MKYHKNLCIISFILGNFTALTPKTVEKKSNLPQKITFVFQKCTKVVF
jgi:hypothetical protein